MNTEKDIDEGKQSKQANATLGGYFGNQTCLAYLENIL